MFMESLHKRLGPQLMMDDLADLYAQCDVDRNEYLLLESFVDHKKDDLALSVGDNKFIVKGKKRSYPILRSCTQSMLRSIPQHRALNMGQPLISRLTIS